MASSAAVKAAEARYLVLQDGGLLGPRRLHADVTVRWR